jgi:cell division protein FtsW (lipid II flippase)
MSYRERRSFDGVDAETVQRSRRIMSWLIPLLALQQGFVIFGRDRVSEIVGTISWTCLLLTLLWIFLGLPMRWLSERDQAIVNDERSRMVRGDAAAWGIAALIVIGCGMMVARLWAELNAGIVIYALVNGALLVSMGRYLWLNRAEPEEDE